MMRTIKILAAVLLLISLEGSYCSFAKNNSHNNKSGIAGFSELPPLPGNVRQPDLAGAYSGFVGNEIIITGGANFPEKPLWFQQGFAPLCVHQFYFRLYHWLPLEPVFKSDKNAIQEFTIHKWQIKKEL